MALTKEELLAARLKTEFVPAPELGGEIVVSELTGLEADRLDQAEYPLTGSGKVEFQWAGNRARWVIACCRDGAGKPLFEEEDLSVVSALPASLLNRLLAAAKRVNGETPEQSVEAKAKN
jgi:hypothetical protein